MPPKSIKGGNYCFRDAYETLPKVGTGFPLHYFDLGRREVKRTRRVTIGEYQKIIRTYIEIWLRELYGKAPHDLYFPLGGRLALVHTPAKVFTTSKGKVRSDARILWLWYKRTSYRHYTYMKLVKKLSDTLIEIEKQWLRCNDVEMLPSWSKFMDKLYHSNKIYYTWPKQQ